MRTQREFRLSLSGELPPNGMVTRFNGVGLLRSEYILREHGAFISEAHGLHALETYVENVCEMFHSKDVWYRTVDLWSDEASSLEGIAREAPEHNPLVGLRGLARSLRYVQAFETELAMLARIANRRLNLHVLFPFVRDAEQFREAMHLLRAVRWRNRVGSMLEVPSAILDVVRLRELGSTMFLVGLNDLTSLLTGSERGLPYHDKAHPSVMAALEFIHASVDVEWGVAGSLTRDVVARLSERTSIPFFSVHFHESPGIVPGISPSMLGHDADHVARVRKLTRERTAQSRLAAGDEAGSTAFAHAANFRARREPS